MKIDRSLLRKLSEMAYLEIDLREEALWQFRKAIPMLLAGGRKLGFKHGQHLKWKGDERSASDLYLTILQQLGCPVESFKESQGAISELRG